MDNGLVNESIGGGGIEVPVSLATVEVEGLGGMNMAALQAICKAEGLTVAGKKDDLIKRLKIAKDGRTDRHVNAGTKCRICGMPTVVQGTHKAKMADGRTMVTRKMKCTGKHRHTYPLKKIEGVAKKV